MNTKTDDWGPGCEGPFPGSLRVEKMVSAFLRCAAEFSESVLVVAVSNPQGGEGTTHFTIRNQGNPHASDSLSRMWVEGGLSQGGWFVTPGGIMARVTDDGEEPLAWDDGVERKLEGLSDALAIEISPMMSGVLVLASADAGPHGSTKVFTKAYGNSMACGGALNYWLRNKELADG